MKICPYCSESIQDTATKCRHCGETLPDARPAPKGDDLSEVLQWVFQDPGWLGKLAIHLLCILLLGCFLIPAWMALGYKVRVMRQQARAPGATPMPEWDDLGGLCLDGLKLWLCFLLMAVAFMLPPGILFGVGVGIDVLMGAPLFSIIAGVCFYLWLIFGSFALAYVIPAIEVEFLLTGSPFASWHFGRIWRRVSTRPGDYFMMFIFHFVAGLIAQFLFFLLLPISWAQVTQGAMIGRWVAQQRAKDAALGL